jgi:hypothetical protein
MQKLHHVICYHYFQLAYSCEVYEEVISLPTQPSAWRIRALLFIQHLPLHMYGKGDPASSYATSGIAFEVFSAYKLPHQDKVGIPAGQNDS